MKKIISVLIVITMLALTFTTAPVCSAAEMPTAKVSEVVNLGGVNVEYAVYGDENAEPMLLLPPNGGDMHSFDGDVLPALAKDYRVICVSPRGTGKSDHVEGGMTFEAISDDVKALLDYLDIEKTHIFGFSDGGNLGIVFTLRHGEYVKSLAVMGSNINTWGTKTFTQLQITYQWIILCIEARIYDDPEYARRRDIKGMMVGQPKLTFKDLEVIDVPFFNIYGEHDMMWRWHSRGITKAVKNAKELMFEGGGHSDYLDRIAPELITFFASVK